MNSFFSLVGLALIVSSSLFSSNLEEESIRTSLALLPKETVTQFGGIDNLEDPHEQVEQILGLEERLNNKVFGQERATRVTADSVIRAYAGLCSDEKPYASLLFLGPTGVGKTELTKVLAEELYGDRLNLLRLNMSEFNNEGGVWRLIGSSPGYVNHEDGGLLTNYIQQHSSGIVLLDEIEKAHREVLMLLLHILDEGRLTDNKGQWLDCTRYYFIMTSNLCATTMLDLEQKGLSHAEIMNQVEPQLMRALTPELYNRVRPVMFGRLQPEIMQQLVKKELERLSATAYRNLEIEVTFDQTVIDYLAKHGYSESLGARPLQRLIDEQIVSFLAREIVLNGYTKSERLLVMVEEELFYLQVEIIPVAEEEPEEEEEYDPWFY